MTAPEPRDPSGPQPGDPGDHADPVGAADHADPAAAPDAPLFVLRTRVWFDELDLVGVLHNARYAIHAERATTAWFGSRPELADSPDQFHLVKAYEVEFRAPIAGEGEFDVELRVAKLGRTSCTYGFRVVGLDGTVHAVGTRTIVRVGRDRRPVAWDPGFRRLHGDLGADEA